MARIAGVDLPREKRLELGLTYIYGIGRDTSNKICEATGVSADIRVKDLTDEQVAKLRNYIEHNLIVEGELRKKVDMDIQRNWLLSRRSPQKRTSCSWTEHSQQCAHKKRT